MKRFSKGCFVVKRGNTKRTKQTYMVAIYYYLLFKGIRFISTKSIQRLQKRKIFLVHAFSFSNIPSPFNVLKKINGRKRKTTAYVNISFNFGLAFWKTIIGILLAINNSYQLIWAVKCSFLILKHA